MGTSSVIKKFFPPDEHDGDGDECNCFSQFKPVVTSIRFDVMPAYALSVRKDLQISQNSATTDEDHLTTAPNVLADSYTGSFHIAFLIEFADGLKWMLKVPVTGYHDRFTKVEARALTSEAMTMRLLKRATTIPVPEVYSFNNTTDNILNCPFILMEFMPGTSLAEYWFGGRESEVPLDQLRETALVEVALAMLQLNKFMFSQGGAPLFDKNGDMNGVGPLKQMDIAAMWKRYETEGGDEMMTYQEAGPFCDLKSFLLSMLKFGPTPSHDFDLGCNKLLQLIIDWIPDNAGSDRHDFVLTHPDFNLQNILVSGEGHLLGLIDWDGVTVVPHCLGNERYPEWLMNDWNPWGYGYKTDPNAEGASNQYENSPEELASYRSKYQQIIKTSGSSQGTALTRNSIVIKMLKKAVDDHQVAAQILEAIFEDVARQNLNDIPTDSKYGDYIRVWDIFDLLVEGKLDDLQLQWVKNGFRALSTCEATGMDVSKVSYVKQEEDHTSSGDASDASSNASPDKQDESALIEKVSASSSSSGKNDSAVLKNASPDSSSLSA